MKRYQITTPTNKLTKTETKLKHQAFFNNPQNHTLTKTFIYLSSIQPTNTGDLADFMTKMTEQEYNKYQIKTHLRRLNLQGYISTKKIGDLTNKIKHTEEEKAIIQKHDKFLERISPHFRKNFNKVQYYYINKFGEQFITYCAQKVLKYEIKEIK